MNTKQLTQHAQAVVGVFLGVFLSTWLQSDSVTIYLSHHSWLADIAGSAFAAYHVVQTYKPGAAPPEAPQPPKENP